MILNGEQFSRVRLVFGVSELYYRIDVFLSNDRNSTCDMFPSMEFAQFADLIYCIDNDDFIKFRWEPAMQPIYRDFFKEAYMPKKTLAELKTIIEDAYDVKLHVWNKEKWQIFSTLE